MSFRGFSRGHQDRYLAPMHRVGENNGSVMGTGIARITEKVQRAVMSFQLSDEDGKSAAL